MRSTSSTRARSSTSSRARSAQELDYRQEARNAQAFHRNFAGHPHVTVPRVYWSYTSHRVLTLEYLDGVQLADLELDQWTIEQRRRLAYVIAEAWLTMIFRHGFFHGDPHPANILVLSPERIGARRLRALREADRQRPVEADPPLHRRREREHRGAPAPARRPRRALPEGEGRGVHLRAPPDLLALLRLEPQRDRPAAGDPGGVRADLLDEPAPAVAVRDARQGDRDDRLGRRRPLPGLQRVRGREALRPRR